MNPCIVVTTGIQDAGRASAAASATARSGSSRLEEYQKDLEQEVADVADLIRRLKEEKTETATV